ncbi:MAG: preprotein translocase subunit SecY [Firmicutes bacterium]|nr:preprotein translocase subunit SecY [Bacillota bacterium]HKM18003.1 preprotein translocase subunit SecY [Limnochordia bacterium]
MLEALRNAWRIPELRRKIIYTAILLAVGRIGAYVPVPGVNAKGLAEQLGLDSGNIFGLMDLFTGGALSRFTLFSMGVGPYITASIIIQLLATVIPKLEQMIKDDPKVSAKFTRYGTVVLGLIQAFATTMMARNWGVVTDEGLFSLMLIIVSLVAGTSFLMWLGEKISEKGIGNGISMLIFIGIVAEIPTNVRNVALALQEGAISIIGVIAYVIVTVVLIAGIVLVQEGQRRIPVQYAKRVVGRRMYGGQSTHIPLKVNQAGVIPVIFASSILTFPLTLAQFIPAVSRLQSWIGYGTVGYNILYVGMIIFFTYFYTAVTFNPQEIADNMKKNGGFVPGLRPGRPTAEYMERVLARITLPGAIFLAIIAVMPFVVSLVTRIPQNILNLGGTGMIIMVGVALDTMKQIESHLLLRHYEGFLN